MEAEVNKAEQRVTESEQLHIRSSQSEKELLGAEGKDDTTHGGDRKELKEKKKHHKTYFSSGKDLAPMKLRQFK